MAAWHPLLSLSVLCETESGEDGDDIHTLLGVFCQGTGLTMTLPFRPPPPSTPQNKKATEEAFAGGWFHTGDLAVQHKNGRIQIKDRSKDIIIRHAVFRRGVWMLLLSRLCWGGGMG